METILSPKSICSNCTNGNKNSLSWGGQGFVSFGCQNIVNIVHVQSVKLVQSLENHSALVVKTAWKPPPISFNSIEKSSLLLASADVSGTVFIWDVVRGSVITTFSDAKKSAKDLHWISPSSEKDIIMIVHSNTVSAWSLKDKECTPIWSQPFNDVLQLVTPHPLITSHFSVIGSSSIFIYFNFDCENEPVDSGTLYHLYSKRGEILKPKYLISSRDERVQAGDLEQCSLKECINFQFHPHYRDHAVFTFPRDIFIFDIEIGVCASNISLDKHVSPFSAMYFCSYTNDLIAVHDSGQLSFRQVSNKLQGEGKVKETQPLTIHSYNPVRYSLSAQTDALRLPRQARPLASAVEPTGERQISVLMSSGRLFIWRLQLRPANPPLFSLSGLYSGHSGGISCMRIVPGFASGNLEGYRPLVAIGCQTGNVQVVNLSSGNLELDYAVSPLPITSIDWAGSKRIVCAAVMGGAFSLHPADINTSSSSNIKNEIYAISLPSGKVIQLKSSRNDGSQVSAITCSHSGSLAVVIYGSGAVDIWDLDTCHVVRTLNIHAAAAQWTRRRIARSSSDAEEPGISPTPSQSDGDIGHIDELLIVSASGRLLRFVFSGKSAQEKPLNFDVHVLSAVTAMAWKGRFILAAEVDGKIVIENIVDQRYITLSTNRSSGISIRRMVFSPGRRNYTFLALYSDGSCDLCNAESGEITNSLRVRQDNSSTQQGSTSRAVDVDFWAPGIPVLAMTTGSIRILNFDFQFDNCPVSARLRRPELVSPYLVADGGKQLISQRFLAQHNEGNVNQDWPPAWLLPYWPYLNKSKNLADRYSVVARVLGSDAEYRFWLSVTHYLWADKENTCLSPSMGLICSDEKFREHALDGLRRQISTAELPQQRRRLADILGAYGDQESAASALLATQPTDPHFIQDWLKACLIDASNTNDPKTATVKLVATNLLADGHIFDGIHLLCLVGLHYDACRYLQTSGFWLDSVKLAKCTLPKGHQQVDIVKKYVYNMVASNSTPYQTSSQRLFAVLLLISVGQFRSAVELLLQYRWADLAGRLAETIIERHGLDAFSNDAIAKESDSSRIKDPLLEVATASLARLLADFKLGAEASHCASRCSPERHAALVREIELLCSDSTTS